MSANEIRKQVVLRAPRERVWEAITDPLQFGMWFGVELEGPFVAGQQTVGRIVPTKVDAAVARLQAPQTGLAWRILVEEIRPMTLFSFRWHPFAVDPTEDYDDEPMTLVSFELADAQGGTLLTIVETGFEQLSVARRQAALKANSGGWEHQARLVGKYLALREEGALGQP